MKKQFCTTAFAFAALCANATVKIPAPPPAPAPVVRVPDLRTDEKPVEISYTRKTVESNTCFKRVKASFVFTNPNGRAMSGDFEFPLPDGAVVCGYALEIDGTMVQGVVCEKGKARVAFENEMRKGVDPGIVEHVKGNIWKTRIFPLIPKTPRRAEVEYVAPDPYGMSADTIIERDGDDWFAAGSYCAPRRTAAETIADFKSGTILWDASLSAKDSKESWIAKLGSLPESGDWTLVVFRNVPENPRRFTAKHELVATLEAAICDGGTDISRAAADVKGPVLVFTDEMDTLGPDGFDCEKIPNAAIASRPDEPARFISVRKISEHEAKSVKSARRFEGRLLATVWAARRMQDLASQADFRKEEFLALGRKYGVAGPGLSLIVLETLDQWLEHKIEPPADSPCHAEWMRRRAAEDDPIAAKKLQAEHENKLLKYWEERVKWWKDPKPRRRTPSSGLFGRAERESARAAGPRALIAERNDALAPEDVATAAPMACMAAAPDDAPAAERAPAARNGAGRGRTPSVTLKAWDPKTPYIDALNASAKGAEYAAYLKERDSYSKSPAFYLDCAGWFFAHGDKPLAERIISNLAEFRLEDPALWRTMGWRLREAGSYDFAVLAFRKVLAMRGEEPQSRRDLAIVLAERGKETRSKADLEEAARLFADAAFKTSARRSARRSNDFQTSVVALEELNGLIAWIDAAEWKDGKPAVPEFDAAYRRDLPVKLRIAIGWDTDMTDIDIHVLEPNGEEAFYQNRRTAEGGFVSEDVTTGYGPEEYLKKDLEEGVYKILTNYYASRQTALTGATTVTATVYTDWGTAQEKRRILTLRLDKPKEKHLIGEVKL